MLCYALNYPSLLCMGVGNGIGNAEADNLQVGGSAYAFAWLHLSVLACSDRGECRKSIVWQLWGKYPDGLQDVGNGHGREGQRILALSFPDALPGMRCRFARINGKL